VNVTVVECRIDHSEAASEPTLSQDRKHVKEASDARDERSSGEPRRKKVKVVSQLS
jgi:hypothetical protein